MTERQLEAELEEAWIGEGNSLRVPFMDWLEAMADNSRGTMQEAAKALLKHREGQPRRCPYCGGNDCRHFIGWTEDGKDIEPRKPGPSQPVLPTDKVVSKWGRVYRDWVFA